MRMGGWIFVAAVPICWAMLGPRAMKPTLGGQVEVFGDEEINAGTWASGLLTVILLAAAFSVPHVGLPAGKTGESLTQLGRMAPEALWIVLPWICQLVAIAVALAVLRWQEAREA